MGPQDACCPISINDLFDMHNTAVLYRESWTALPKGDFFKGYMRDAIGKDMAALGNGALKNAIISIASKVWRTMLIS